ncbi:hypothetical protein JOL62DRAFT_594814 [Phyllosticta paracitricarpa]|uniref:Uncharacterized protein n=1 Tax=Phyllosticta paracitricarpa TaxID=2016321 RepID=A0ABR1MWV4_9PEZI
MSEPAKEHEKIHKPAFVTSTGKLNYFRKARKPPAAGSATNCQSCPLERDSTPQDLAEDYTPDAPDDEIRKRPWFGRSTWWAFTEKICERRGRIYGTEGEIEYDSTTIKVHNFATGKTMGAWKPKRAQRSFIGCTLEEVLQSHAMVFAAEEARKQKKVVDWPSWPIDSDRK